MKKRHICSLANCLLSRLLYLTLMAGRMICRSSPSSRLVAGWLLLSSCSLSMALHRSSNMLNISKETTKAHSCHAERHPPAIRASMIDTGKKKTKGKQLAIGKRARLLTSVDIEPNKKVFSGGGPTRARCWRRLTNHLLAQPNGQFRSKLFILVCREREFLVASVASRPWPSVKPRGERERENIKKKRISQKPEQQNDSRAPGERPNGRKGQGRRSRRGAHRKLVKYSVFVRTYQVSGGIRRTVYSVPCVSFSCAFLS